MAASVPIFIETYTNPVTLAFWTEAGAALALFLITLVMLLTRFYGLLVRALATRQQAMAELERTAERLREREERLGLVMQGTNDGIWDWNLDTDEVYFSPQWKAMLGYAEAEIPPHVDGWRRLVHPDDLDRAAAAIQAHRDGQSPFYTLEHHRLRHKDGSYRWILARGVSLRDAGGRAYRMAGSHTDITVRRRTEDTLRQHLAFERLITSISSEFINLGPDEIDAGIRRALQAVGEFSGDERGYIFQFSFDQTIMNNTHEWCADGIESFIDQLQEIPVSTFPWLMKRLNRFEVIQLPRLADLPAEARAEQAEFEAQGIQSLIIVPMVYGGTLVGFVGFDSVRGPEGKIWSDDSIALLKIVGEIFVNALQHKQAQAALQLAYQTLERQVEERTRALVTLNSMAAVVSRSLDLEEILSTALEETLEVMGVEAGAAYQVDETGQMLILLAQRGLSEDFVQYTGRLPLKVALAGQEISYERPVCWSLQDYPEGEMKERLKQEALQLIIGVPLVAKGALLGGLVLSTRQPRALSPEESSLLMAIGRQIGIAVDNARLYEAEQARLAEAEKRRQVAEGMREILAVLNSRQSLGAILEFIVTQACQVLESDAASLLQLEAQAGELLIQSACGLDPDYVSGLRLRVGHGGAGRALAERRPVAIPDMLAAAASTAPEDMPPEPQRTLLARLIRRYRAILSVPLIIQDEPYGAISPWSLS